MLIAKDSRMTSSVSTGNDGNYARFYLAMPGFMFSAHTHSLCCGDKYLAKCPVSGQVCKKKRAVTFYSITPKNRIKTLKNDEKHTFLKNLLRLCPLSHFFSLIVSKIRIYNIYLIFFCFKKNRATKVGF